MAVESRAAPSAAPTALQRAGAYMWAVLFASTLVQTTASFGSQAVSPLAPFLSRDLGLSKAQIGGINTAFYIGAVVVLTLAGLVSDRLGVRRMFLVGLLGCGLPLLVVAQAPGLEWIMAGALLSGIGNAIALPSTTRAIIYWFPVRVRGLAMGVKQTGVALAGMIMGPVAPRLAEAFTWRGAVNVIAWLTIGAGLLAWWIYREHPDASAAQAKTRAGGPGVRGLLGNRNLLLLTAASYCLAFVQLSQVVFMVTFLNERLGFDVVVAGGLLALAQLGGVIGRIGWGAVSDALFGGHRRAVMMLIAGGAAICSLATSQIGPGIPWPALWLLLFLTGITAIGWNGINMTFVGELAGRSASASAAGLNLTGSYLGIITGPPLFGKLVDVTQSYGTSYLVVAGVAVLALGLLWSIRVGEAPAS
jgi:sugar phosphate permease